MLNQLHCFHRNFFYLFFIELVGLQNKMKIPYKHGMHENAFFFSKINISLNENRKEKKNTMENLTACIHKWRRREWVSEQKRKRWSDNFLKYNRYLHINDFQFVFLTEGERDVMPVIYILESQLGFSLSPHGLRSVEKTAMKIFIQRKENLSPLLSSIRFVHIFPNTYTQVT